MLHAKQQLFRTLDDTNPDPRLAALEDQVMATVNSLGVGPMGFGGGTTLIGCKVGVQNRLPASFFVSIAYDCWAFRRLGVLLDPQTGAIREWQFRDPAQAAIPMVDAAAGTQAFKLTGQEKVLRDADRRGDDPLPQGRRRRAGLGPRLHRPRRGPPSPDVARAAGRSAGSVLYHCGPVVRKDGDAWTVTAAGPTTSIREEPYQADIIKRYGVRAVMGKGGMGGKTLAALKESGAVYLNAIGGAAQFYARRITKVDGVSLLEFGTPEAMWHLQLDDFPAIVTMDAHGKSLHQEIEAASAEKLSLLRA